MNETDQNVNLTVGELFLLSTQMPPALSYFPDTKISIEANRHRACLKDPAGKVIAWIKRGHQKIPVT